MPELQLISTPSEHADGSASVLVSGLRAHFQAGATKPLSWRLSQLGALQHFLMEREQDIFAALHADLGKPATEAFTSEVGSPQDEPPPDKAPQQPSAASS